MTTPPQPTAGLRNIRPWGDAARDIHISAAGEISAIEPVSERPLEPGEIDGRGLLALPGFVNAHAHIDMTWFGFPWQSYGGEGGTEGRIRHDRARRGEFGRASCRERV